jgi:hypothetical protein
MEWSTAVNRPVYCLSEDMPPGETYSVDVYCYSERMHSVFVGLNHLARGQTVGTGRTKTATFFPPEHSVNTVDRFLRWDGSVVLVPSQETLELSVRKVHDVCGADSQLCV